MKTQSRSRFTSLAALGSILVSSISFASQAESISELSLSPDERLVTLIGTNDVHGGVEPTLNRDGKKVGGSALFLGVVNAIRAGLSDQYGNRAGVVVLDAGDQFQGTLISNYTEGELVYRVMNEVGYDAVIPGNHGYDFGPHGWLQDRVTPENPDQNPRGVIEHLAKDVAQFPLLSANTYLKSSLKDAQSEEIEVDSVGCRPKQAGASIVWAQAQRPEFLSPYRIVEKGGVRVAIIGIDNVNTSHTTTAVNVSDLCFRDEAESYLEVRRSLEGKADVFILLIHDGNIGKQQPINQLVKKLLKESKGSVDAVIAGHTHQVNHDQVNSVPIIQSGSSGKSFGRVDLVWNSIQRKVVVAKTRYFAGVRLNESDCDRFAASFCQVDASGQLLYEGKRVLSSSAIEKLIADQRVVLAPLSNRVVGRAQDEVRIHRINESPMANELTDLLRIISKADVAMMNTGGIRASFGPGTITYEDLFRVLPFSNRAWMVGPMSVDRMLEVLRRSAASCGQYGALMQSGLRVSFTRDCDKHPDGVDPDAKLVRVETLDGRVVYDSRTGQKDTSLEFKVATLDFIADGGDRYSDFKGLPLIQDFGIAREEMATFLIAHPHEFSSQVDRRWRWMNSGVSAEGQK